MEYEAPKLEVIELDVVDIIQTSGDGGAGGENELPPYFPTTLDADY